MASGPHPIGLGISKSEFHVIQTETVPPPGSHHERQISSQSSIARFKSRRDELLTRYRRLRYWATLTSVAASVISGTLAVAIDSIMIYVIHKFNTTKDIPMQNRPWGPWALQSVVWPTVLFLVMSLLSTVLAVATLSGFLWQARRRVIKFSLGFVVVHVLVWIIVVIIYRAEKTNKDLWGWSCTTKAKAIELELGNDKLKFEGLCNIQAASWGISIALIIVKVITGALSWYLDREQEGVRTDLAGDVSIRVLDQFC